MSVPEEIRSALVTLAVAVITATTGLVGAAAYYGAIWLRQRAQSMAIASAQTVAGGAGYRAMAAASANGATYQAAERAGLQAATDAVQAIGSPTVTAMSEQAVGAIVHSGLGAALQADPAVNLSRSAP